MVREDKRVREKRLHGLVKELRILTLGSPAWRGKKQRKKNVNLNNKQSKPASTQAAYNQKFFSSCSPSYSRIPGRA
jgi:hypothetical protein